MNTLERLERKFANPRGRLPLEHMRGHKRGHLVHMLFRRELMPSIGYLPFTPPHPEALAPDGITPEGYPVELKSGMGDLDWSVFKGRLQLKRYIHQMNVYEGELWLYSVCGDVPTFWYHSSLLITDSF